MSRSKSTTRTGESRSSSGTTDGPTFDAIVAGETIQTAVAQLTALVDECHIQLHADRIRMPATDPAAVASVDVQLTESAFEAFEATEGTLGVDLTRVTEIVGMADAEQPVHLSYDPETRKLHITIGELEYTLALIDPDSIRSPPDLSDPGFEFTAGATLNAADVARVIKATSMVSDHVALGIDAAQSGDSSESFYAQATGDTDDVEIVLQPGDLIDIDAGDAHSLYSLDYLADIDRAIPRDAAVDLHLGTEVPLGFSYEFAAGGGTVEYLLGPRIARQ